MDIQSIHKKRCMLRAISIPSVLEHIVRKLPHGLKIFGFLALLLRGLFCGKTGRNGDNQDNSQRDVNTQHPSHGISSWNLKDSGASNEKLTVCILMERRNADNRIVLDVDVKE